jgi:hypothetical protein
MSSRPSRLIRLCRESRRAWSTEMGVKAGHKPGSVHATTDVGLQRVGGYLSGTAVTDGLERRVQTERGQWPAVVPWPCSQPGFTEPAPLDAAGALLPHLCTLACAWGSPHGAIGGVFLWHSPHGHPHWALPSKPGHQGARTFLSRHSKRSTATTSPAFSPHHASRA